MAKRTLAEVITSETMQVEFWHFRVDWKYLDGRCHQDHRRDCTPRARAGLNDAGGHRTA